MHLTRSSEPTKTLDNLSTASYEGGNMKSHLRWTLLGLTGALSLLATCLAMGAGTSQNLVINGDFESGNTGFKTAYTLGDDSNPGGYTIGANPSTAPGAFGDWCRLR